MIDTFKSSIPQEILSVITRHMKANAYLVGGIVRDSLLNIQNHDIDIVVDGDGIKFGEELAKRLGARLDIHKKFMTAVLTLKSGQRIDIATSRVEYYRKPAELPGVEAGSIKQDLARRDFTINSLALSLNDKNFGEILDFFGGREDIKNRKIRVLHKRSFIEDPTRIFRAVRFEKRLGFKMDKQTEALARSAIDMDIVSRLTGARIRDELIYILNEDRPFNAIKRLYDLGALSKIGITQVISKEFTKDMRKAISSYIKLKPYQDSEPVKWRLLLIMMLGGDGAAVAESWCHGMKIRRKDIAVIVGSIKKISEAGKELGKEVEEDSKLYDIVRRYPPELQVICHSRGGDHAKNIRRYLAKLVNIKLEISGEDLKELGYKPSPVFKEVLGEVLRQKINGKISGRESELAAARELIKDPGMIYGDKAHRLSVG